MATEKQRAANRANSRFSTGPKSISGKLKSSQNATKHGIYSVQTLLLGEDAKLYEAVRKEQRKRFNPKTYVDKALVDQLVAELWRLRRLSQTEYLLGVEIQEHLTKTQPLKFTKNETRLLSLLETAPEETAARFAKYSRSVKSGKSSLHPPKGDSDYTTSRQLQILEQITTKKTQVDKVYADMFIYRSQENIRKLIFLKRQGLQTILSIERELERRVSGREDSEA